MFLSTEADAVASLKAEEAAKSSQHSLFLNNDDQDSISGHFSFLFDFVLEVN